MLETLTKEIWAGYLNEPLVIAGSIEMELVEVHGLGNINDRAKREPFSILFRGPREPLLAQQIYPLRHARLGALDLFLVPIGRWSQSTLANSSIRVLA